MRAKRGGATVSEISSASVDVVSAATPGFDEVRHEAEGQLVYADGTRTASGTLAVTVGDASLAGPFEAKLCPTRIQSRDKAEPIHGVEWTTDEVPAKSIPPEPAQGFVVDGPFAETKELVHGVVVVVEAAIGFVRLGAKGVEGLGDQALGHGTDGPRSAPLGRGP